MANGIELKGVAPLLVDIRKLPDALKDQTIKQVSNLAFESMLKGAARHTKTGGTGRLYASLDNKPIQGGGRRVAHDLSQTQTLWYRGGGLWSYSVFVNFGSRPHVIEPRNKKALRWATPDGFAFSGGHEHPGYKGDNYRDKAIDESIDALKDIVRRTLRDNL